MSRKLIKAYPHLADLNNDDLDILARIIKLRPTWMGYTSIGEWNHQRFLQIVIPSAITGYQASFSYHDGDLTIGFDRGHVHAYTHQGINHAIDIVIEYMEAIINEKWIFALRVVQDSWWKMGQDTQLYGFYTHEEFSTLSQETHIYTRSYNGTFDHVYRVYQDEKGNTYP